MTIASYFEETFRLLSMKLVLAPAAYLLPRSWALAIADMMALFLATSPKPGVEVYWQMRRAFEKNRLESFSLSWGWFARPFRDFVVLKRLLYKREYLSDWTVIETNAEAVKSIKESGEPYVLAVGHFARQANVMINSASVNPGHPIYPAHDVPGRNWPISNARMRAQLGTFRAVDYLRNDLRFVFLQDDPHPARTLNALLSERGNFVGIAIDAPWEGGRRGSFQRPFAGLGNRAFATGVARMARMAQCPIVSCICGLDSHGNIILEWGDPIRILPHEEEREISVTNELLDRLEKAIGERPTQYVLDVGGDRRWNSSTKQWERLT